ncbi:MAG: aminotransferase class V-fold PLP-dependent enzyme [Bryobacteraceae bacterium]|nr:aminotransferase class V-fold PLP-dependent enzyme [Bryobacteraceae bacterium]
MQPNWPAVRAEFPALSNWTCLNAATYGQMPRAAADAINRHVAQRDENGCVDFLSWFDDMDAIRASCARLIHCEPDDIAFTVNSATGLATLILGLQWQPGDEVLTLDDEFPNQLYTSVVLEGFGVRLRTVPWRDFHPAVTGRTRLAILSTVNYSTGWRLPAEEVSEYLRRRNVLLYLDGSQSIGALRFDVKRVRPSALCVDAYKWMLSPNGAGWLYVDPELRPRLPATVVGWRSDRTWRSVDTLNHGNPLFAEAAEKYEGGMLCFPSLYGMGAVIDRMLEIGPAAIETRVLDLAGKARSMLGELGAQVSQDQSPIVTAVLPALDSSELVRKLQTQRILVSSRKGKLRVSPHFYNDESDLAILREALTREGGAAAGSRIARLSPTA